MFSIIIATAMLGADHKSKSHHEQPHKAECPCHCGGLCHGECGKKGCICPKDGKAKVAEGGDVCCGVSSQDIAKLTQRVAALEADIVILKTQAGLPPRPYNVAPRVTPIAHPGEKYGDRWAPFPGNSAYEVYGHEDAQGVFRYSLFRKRAGAPIPSSPSPSCHGGACRLK